MKLYYHLHQDGSRNFGDDLNPWFWQKLLPGVFNEDESTLFVGIGTILNERLPSAKRTVVFSSGYGYAKSGIKVDDSWKIYCVRGPMTARALSLPVELAITDGAALLKSLYDPQLEKKYQYSFMPHVSHAIDRWKDVCDSSNVHYIDPCADAFEIIDDITRTEILITEAMHGAIAADSYGVPWIPVTSAKMISEFKWQDYCASMNHKYEPLRVPNVSQMADRKPLTLMRAGAKKKWAELRLKKIVRKAKPIVCKESIHEDRCDRLLEKLELFKTDLAKGLFV